MPGPNSAPNGDIRLVGSGVLMCVIHGDKRAKCDPKKGCRTVRLREYLHMRNRLVTGKTRATRG